MGWGLDVHWAAVAARARLADRDRRRHADRPHAAPGGQRLRARRGRGARRAPSSPGGPTCAATRCERWRSTGEGGDRQRVLSARPRPRAGRLGPPPGAGGARRRAPTCACSCCTGPIPRAPRACATRRARCAPWPPSRGAPSSTASTCATCRSSPRRARAATGRGAPGRRRRWRPPCAGCAASSPTTSCTPTTRSRRPTPCCARASGAPLVVSVHGGDVYFTAPRYPAGARAVRRAFGAARLVLANSAGIEERGAAPGRARDTRVVRLGTDVPEQPPHKEPDPRSSPSRTSSRASATPTSCARCGCCASATRSCATWSSATAPSASRWRGWPPSSGWPIASSSPASCRASEALARARAAHVFVMPSVDEAFGVAYVEAMAAGLPAVGARGEAGPAGDRAPRATGCGSSRPPTSRRSRPSSTRCWPSPPTCRSSARAPAPPSRAPSPGRSAGARRWRPTRTRCGDAGPCSSSPTTSRPTAPARSARCTSAWRCELALFGGRSHHATARARGPGRALRRVGQREVHALAASGRYAAVVCGTAGRVALPAAFLGAAARARRRSCSGARCGAT